MSSSKRLDESVFPQYHVRLAHGTLEGISYATERSYEIDAADGVAAIEKALRKFPQLRNVERIVIELELDKQTTEERRARRRLRSLRAKLRKDSTDAREDVRR